MAEPAAIDRDPDIEARPWDREDVPWSVLDLDQLREAYWAYVAPEMRTQGFDPETDRPTYEWLADNGFRGLTYALREYHDRSFGEFWGDDLDTGAADGYDWAIEDDATRESMQEYVEETFASRDSQSSTATLEARRYRLARFARAHRAIHGTDDLLTPIAPDSDVDETAAIKDVRKTFAYLSDELASGTVARIHDIVRAWYGDLVDIRAAAFNPTDGIEDRHDWSRSGEESDPVALSAAHVRGLQDEAVSIEDRLLVVALCAWGLRMGEVAALHRDQLVFGEEPHVAFEERKNGPGTVNIVYGAEVAKSRIRRLDRDADWNGYLYPSERSRSGHLTPQVLRSRFHDLADAADVPEEIEGIRRKPQMARRYWYDAYAQTIDDVLEHVGEIAEEQGSSSARVVLDRYLSEQRQRELRRDYMRERLEDAFSPRDNDDG